MASLVTCGMGASWNFIDTKKFTLKCNKLNFKILNEKKTFNTRILKLNFKIKAIDG